MMFSWRAFNNQKSIQRLFVSQVPRCCLGVQYKWMRLVFDSDGGGRRTKSARRNMSVTCYPSFVIHPSICMPITIISLVDMRLVSFLDTRSDPSMVCWWVRRSRSRIWLCKKETENFSITGWNDGCRFDEKCHVPESLVNCRGNLMEDGGVVICTEPLQLSWYLVHQSRAAEMSGKLKCVIRCKTKQDQRAARGVWISSSNHKLRDHEWALHFWHPPFCPPSPLLIHPAAASPTAMPLGEDEKWVCERRGRSSEHKPNHRETRASSEPDDWQFPW